MLTVARSGNHPLMSDVTVWKGAAYLSGQVAFDHRFADFETQTRAVFDRIDAVLATVGTNRRNLLTATVWLVDPARFELFNVLWLKWLGDADRPARATVASGLMIAGLEIEIQVTAAVLETPPPN